MKRILSLACLLILGTAFMFAQEIPEQEDNIQVIYNKNYAGDQFLRIVVSPSFPLDFPDLITTFKGEGQLYVGGFFAFGYGYFLTDNISVGGNAGFGFNVTRGSNSLNYIPVTLRATFHPTVGNFEFPLTAGIGLAWEKYASYTFFPGLVLTAGTGVHYRITSSWSAGLDIEYMYLPEWNKNGYADANILTTELIARYYF